MQLNVANADRIQNVAGVVSIPAIRISGPIACAGKRA